MLAAPPIFLCNLNKDNGMNIFLDLACVITLASRQHILFCACLVNFDPLQLILRGQVLVVQPNVLQATLEVSTPGTHAVTCREPANIRHVPCLHTYIAQGTMMPCFGKDNVPILHLYGHHIILAIGDKFGLSEQCGVRAVNGDSALLQVDCHVWLSFPVELQEKTIVLEGTQQKRCGEVLSVVFRDRECSIAGAVLMTKGPRWIL